MNQKLGIGTRKRNAIPMIFEEEQVDDLDEIQKEPRIGATQDFRTSRI